MIQKVLLQALQPRRVLKACLGIILALSLPIHATQTIRLVTAEWQGFTNADLTGSYFEYLQLVLPPEQFPIKVEFSNFGRAVAALEKQQADMTFGLTMADAPKALRASAPYDSDRIVAIFDPKVQGFGSLTNMSLQSLNGFRLAWDLAYNYGEAMGLHSDGYQVANPEQGISLVANGRIDIYLAEQGDLRTPKVLALLKNPQLRQEEIHQVPVFVGFANHARGQALKKIWDQRILELKNNGQLATFYQQHLTMIVAESVINP